MKQPSVVRGYGLTTVLHHDSCTRLMTFRVMGIVTPSVGDIVARQLHAGAVEFRPRAILADYRGACMCADPRDMIAALDRNNTYDRDKCPPAAAIVSPAAIPLWRGFSWLMAEHGFVRGAFTDAEPALRWLDRKARAMALWLSDWAWMLAPALLWDDDWPGLVMMCLHQIRLFA